MTFYTIVAAIIYYFAGRHVDSPALGAASPLVRKIAYGIALPTIVVAGVINGHVAAKMVYVKFWAWRGKAATITSRSRRAYVSWAVVVTGCWVVAWVLAEAIPIFNELLGLMSALFMSWFSLGFSGMLWLHLNRGGQWRRGVRKMLLTALNVTMIAIAAFSVSFSFASSSSLCVYEMNTADIVAFPVHRRPTRLGHGNRKGFFGIRGRSSLFVCQQRSQGSWALVRSCLPTGASVVWVQQ